MVLGASGSESTAFENDEQTLIDKLYHLLKASVALLIEMTLEHAHPYLKGLIIVD